jgi:hypothetical protein
MQKEVCGLAAVVVIAALAACTPPTEEEKTAAAPPTDAATSTAEAQHVDFEPGATVMVLAGSLGEGQTARYILGAHEGDLLMAHALSPGEDLRVSVHRLDEEAPVPDAVETDSYWAGRLPATCGYLVEVHGAGEEGPYHLEVEIPRHLPLTSVASSVALAGTIQPHAPLAFVAEIEEGRTLTASVTSAEDAVQLTVHGARDGQPLVNWEAETNGYSGEVAGTQDYVFRLDPGAEATGFELSVSVE